MENKVVCSYCGTVYDASEGKCPLCGGSVATEVTEETRPVQRQRLTEEERRQHRRAASSKGGKYASSGKKNRNKRNKKKEKHTTKGMLIAALVFLILAVAVVTWFIGDMIGWWGGLEDTIDRDPEKVTVNREEGCTQLELSENILKFKKPGDSAVITLTINAGCNEKPVVHYPDAAIVKAEISEDTAKSETTKSDTITITAVAEGSTRLSFTCGEKETVCNIYVGEQAIHDAGENPVPGGTTQQPSTESTQPSEPVSSAEPTEPAPLEEDFEPELNFPEDVTLYRRGETVPLQVMNLPAGQQVKWTSADETIAKVDAYGTVTAVSGGSVRVTAEVGGKKAEVLVRCPFDENGNVDAHLQLTDVTIGVGESYDLYLLDRENKRISDGVVYVMDREGVCSLEDGTVTGLSSGSVNFVLTYNTEEYQCIIRVR